MARESTTLSSVLIAAVVSLTVTLMAALLQEDSNRRLEAENERRELYAAFLGQVGACAFEAAEVNVEDLASRVGREPPPPDIVSLDGAIYYLMTEHREQASAGTHECNVELSTLTSQLGLVADRQLTDQASQLAEATVSYRKIAIQEQLHSAGVAAIAVSRGENPPSSDELVVPEPTNTEFATARAEFETAAVASLTGSSAWDSPAIRLLTIALAAVSLFAIGLFATDLVSRRREKGAS